MEKRIDTKMRVMGKLGSNDSAHNSNQIEIEAMHLLVVRRSLRQKDGFCAGYQQYPDVYCLTSKMLYFQPECQNDINMNATIVFFPTAVNREKKTVLRTVICADFDRSMSEDEIALKFHSI